jgi:hypothetical protein
VLNGVLTTEDLKAATGYPRIGDVRRCLEKQGIRYFTGKDGIWTTIGLVEAAKLGTSVHGPDAVYSPEIV